MAAAVVRNYSEAVLQHEQHLPVPCVGAERPAMREHNRLRGLRAPVFAKDACAIGRSDEAHDKLLIELNGSRRHSLTDAAAAKMTSATSLSVVSIATMLDSAAVI